MKKIGFFGGSFNPVTYAHINLAKQIISECNLDKLFFIPIGDFYEKQGLIEFKHRYNMLKLLCNKNNKLEVSDIENNQENKLYAIDIFKIIKNKYPEDDLYYIMGSDNLKQIDKWKEHDKLITDYKYIVLERSKNEFDNIIKENELIKSYIQNYTIISNENYMSISSSLARQKLELHESVKNLIPKEVVEYIHKNNLY